MKGKNDEIPIGGTGMIFGYKVTAKEYLTSTTCDDCCFGLRSGHEECPRRKCDARYRQDKKHVYFVLAEGGDKV